MIKINKDLMLRYPIRKDFGDFYVGRNDPVLAKNMYRGIYPLSLKQARKDFSYFIKNARKKDNLHLVIEFKKKFAGAIFLSSIEPSFKAKIGYWVSRDFRGNGIGTRAIRAMTNYAFKKYKLKRIIANVVTFNKASARALEKSGYKLEGILRKNRYKNNKYYDDFLYAKVK